MDEEDDQNGIHSFQYLLTLRYLEDQDLNSEELNIKEMNEFLDKAEKEEEIDKIPEE